MSDFELLFYHTHYFVDDIYLSRLSFKDLFRICPYYIYHVNARSGANSLTILGFVTDLISVVFLCIGRIGTSEMIHRWREAPRSRIPQIDRCAQTSHVQFPPSRLGDSSRRTRLVLE